jgi:hypothetical protein
MDSKPHSNNAMPIYQSIYEPLLVEEWLATFNTLFVPEVLRFLGKILLESSIVSL